MRKYVIYFLLILNAFCLIDCASRNSPNLSNFIIPEAARKPAEKGISDYKLQSGDVIEIKFYYNLVCLAADPKCLRLKYVVVQACVIESNFI